MSRSSLDHPMALPPTVSTMVSKGTAAANLGTRPQFSPQFGEEAPWGCTQSPWPRGRWRGSNALSWSQAVAAAPSLHKHSALTYLPRITQGDCFHKESCAQIPSPGPFTSRTEGKQAGESMLPWYQIINILDKYFDIKIGISALFLLPWQHHSPVRECTK